MALILNGEKKDGDEWVEVYAGKIEIKSGDKKEVGMGKYKEWSWFIIKEGSFQI